MAKFARRVDTKKTNGTDGSHVTSEALELCNVNCEVSASDELQRKEEMACEAVDTSIACNISQDIEGREKDVPSTDPPCFDMACASMHKEADARKMRSTTDPGDQKIGRVERDDTGVDLSRSENMTFRVILKDFPRCPSDPGSNVDKVNNTDCVSQKLKDEVITDMRSDVAGMDDLSRSGKMFSTTVPGECPASPFDARNTVEQDKDVSRISPALIEKNMGHSKIFLDPLTFPQEFTGKDDRKREGKIPEETEPVSTKMSTTDVSKDAASALEKISGNDVQSHTKLEEQAVPESWLNRKHVRRVRTIVKGLSQKTVVEQDEKTGQRLLVERNVGHRKAVLEEVNAMRRLADSPFFLKFLSYKHVSSMLKKRFDIYFEYYDGNPLELYGPSFFTKDVLRNIFSQVGEALKCMHGERIMHRHLRPENILVNDALEVKFSDFTNALFGPTAIKRCDRKLRSDFNAPEFAEAKGRLETPYSYEIDYFAVGAILYYLLFRVTPQFEKAGTGKVPTSEHDACNLKFPGPVDPDLADLIKSLLHPDPKQRLGEQGYLSHPFFGKSQEMKKEEELCVAKSSSLPELTDFDHLETIYTGDYGVVHLLSDKRKRRLVVDKMTYSDVVELSPEHSVNEINIMQIFSGRPLFIEYFWSSRDSELGNHHVIMEFFNGKMMSETDKGTLPDFQKRILQVCEGLRFVHSKGIIHRDIKCENVLVNKNNQVKIIDFDLATVGPEAVGFAGTYGYISPEVFAHKYNKDSPPYSYAVDWYSAGATVYSLCYGHTLGELKPGLKEPTRAEMKKAWKRGDVYYIHKELPEPLMSFLERLLTKDPCQRLKDDDILDHAFFQM